MGADAAKMRNSYGGLPLFLLLSTALGAFSLLQDCRYTVRLTAPTKQAEALPPPFSEGGGEADSGAPTANASMSVPLTSSVPCEPIGITPPSTLTARELDLQQQRRCLAGRPGWRPPGGYLAICLAARNQHAELPEWLDYHRRLGVSHVYVMDDASQPPLGEVLAPYIEEGLVTHRYLEDYAAIQQELKDTTCHDPQAHHRQMMMYALCLRDYGARHQWMAFIDIDEFFVFTDGTDDLPALLRGFEEYGGVGVNWRFFGSSGHKKRQANTLTAYTQCYAGNEEVHRHIKSVVQPRFTARMEGPHHGAFAPGYFAVTTSGSRVEGAFAKKPTYKRLALHHYVVKSREDFEEKMARGNVMGEESRQESFWQQIESQAVKTCYGGSKAWQRMFGKEQQAEEEEEQGQGMARRRPKGGGKARS